MEDIIKDSMQRIQLINGIKFEKNKKGVSQENITQRKIG